MARIAVGKDEKIEIVQDDEITTLLQDEFKTRKVDCQELIVNGQDIGSVIASMQAAIAAIQAQLAEE